MKSAGPDFTNPFQEVIVDAELYNSAPHKLIYSSMSLVSDAFTIADFRNIECTEYEYDPEDDLFWAIREPIIEWDPKKNPYLAWDLRDHVMAPEYMGDSPDLDDVLIGISRSSVVFSKSRKIPAMLMEHGPTEAQSILLLLAAAGVEIVLPPVFFQQLHAEEISTLKENLAEERNNYIKSIFEIADGARHRIRSESPPELIRWARNEVFFKIKPKAFALEAGTSKQNKKTLQRVGIRTVKDVLPAIIKRLVVGDFYGAGAELMSEFAKKIANYEGKVKIDAEVEYAIRLVEELENIREERK